VIIVNFEIKNTKQKDPAIYKTLYIKQSLADKIEKIANENETSWNNVVISMIESYLKEDK